MFPEVRQVIEEAGNTATLLSILMSHLRTSPDASILPLTEIETAFQRVVQDCRQLLAYLNNALRLWERQRPTVTSAVAGRRSDDGPVASRTRGALLRRRGNVGNGRKPTIKRTVRRRR